MPSLLVLAFLLVCSLCCHAVPAPTEISTSTFSRLVTGAGAVTWNASSLGVYPVFSTPPFSGFTSVAPLTLAFNFSQAQKALMTTNPNAVLLGARIILSYTLSGSPSFPVWRLYLTKNGTTAVGLDRSAGASFATGTGNLTFGGATDAWNTTTQPNECMADGACGFQLTLVSPLSPRSLQLNITFINFTLWWTLDSSAVTTGGGSTGTTGTIGTTGTTGTTGRIGTTGTTTTTGGGGGTSSVATSGGLQQTVGVTLNTLPSTLASSSSSTSTTSTSSSAGVVPSSPVADPIAASSSSSTFWGHTGLIIIAVVAVAMCVLVTIVLVVILIRRRSHPRIESIGELQKEMAKELGGSRMSLEKLSPISPPQAGHVAPGMPYSNMQVALQRAGSGFHLSVTENSHTPIVGLRLSCSKSTGICAVREEISAVPASPSPDIAKSAASDDAWDVPMSALKVQGEIGRGAYGIVFLGSWRCTPVAIKVLECNHSTEEEKEKFQAEMNLMKKLRPHSNVLQLLGTCKEPLCVITEYMPWGSLARLLQSKEVISQATKDKIILGIARGMLHLHMERIVHRDLAARNVLLTCSLQPKISDFGLSRSTVDDWTKTHSSVGPLRWMAPECIRKRVYGPKSDVWAFGVTLVEIFTRRVPYPDLDHLQVASLVSTGELVHPLPAHAPVHYTTLMQRCFAYSPQQRPSFQQICETLAEVVDDSSEGSSSFITELPSSAPSLSQPAT